MEEAPRIDLIFNCSLIIAPLPYCLAYVIFLYWIFKPILRNIAKYDEEYFGRIGTKVQLKYILQNKKLHFHVE